MFVTCLLEGTIADFGDWHGMLKKEIERKSPIQNKEGTLGSGTSTALKTVL